MATHQDDETSNGWPLGLEIMNMRLRVIEGEGEGTQAAPAAVEPDTTHMRTVSFTSLSSSNLDTEVTQFMFAYTLVAANEDVDRLMILLDDVDRLMMLLEDVDGSINDVANGAIIISLETNYVCRHCHQVLPPLQSHRLLQDRRRTQTKSSSQPSSPFRVPKQKPLSHRIFRSPVELSCCVETMLPYHTATASALLTSMLSVSPRIYGWTSEGNFLTFSI
ncbi:hypothetical protein EZV62_026753 [Acer yangbiense]|uniref:Uncharacterized protein n=1 Tax=Acer yangbiense TaxID=1000413 RepID=A0A5C7GSL0_9ROSI|nr:hypothetical protein EZV62_026753 [Acer yangbiense]